MENDLNGQNKPDQDSEWHSSGSTDNNAGGGSVNPPVEDTTTGNEGEAGSAETTTPAA